jgi:hypothetical protein
MGYRCEDKNAVSDGDDVLSVRGNIKNDPKPKQETLGLDGYVNTVKAFLTHIPPWSLDTTRYGAMRSKLKLGKLCYHYVSAEQFLFVLFRL